MHALLPFLLMAAYQPQGQPGQRPPRTGAPESTDQAAPKPALPVIDKTSQHTVNLPSGPVKYTAWAEQIPLGPDGGPVECNMFDVAYIKDGADANTRPITFAFNGGPGSATIWLHMGGLGPKRAPMNDDGSLPAPPYRAVENLESWLDFTDLVLIDAPATGFSRLTNPSFGPKYFGVRQDINAFTNFVRTWLSKHHRWNSPLFVAGESYGGIRGSGLSQSLFRSGIAINGFISISGTSNFMTLDGMRGNDTTYIGFLPSMAACAWYHHKLNARFKTVEGLVKEVQEWIDKEYAPALQRGDSLSDAEKDRIAGKLSEYLGLSKSYCLGSNLKVTEFQYFRELLRDQRLTIGRYDGRLTGKEEFAVGGGSAGDPSDSATTAPFTTALNDYFDKDLDVNPGIPYLNFGPVGPWEEPDGSYAETASDLRAVLSRNPHFKVLYCCGYYDLACPFNATIYTVNHMGLDKESRARVSFEYYPAGHMMYIEKSSRIKLHDDVKRFVADCLK
ncbi:MAG: peptidase S10 [Armatimonadetes bacterium]|nr:peptidase S10 [Armatimonadota bacterium]